MSRTIRQHFPPAWSWVPEGGGRDRKPWHKPPGEFKRLRRRKRKRQANQAIRIGLEPERERHDDAYDWT